MVSHDAAHLAADRPRSGELSGRHAAGVLSQGLPGGGGAPDHGLVEIAALGETIDDGLQFAPADDRSDQTGSVKLVTGYDVVTCLRESIVT